MLNRMNTNTDNDNLTRRLSVHIKKRNPIEGDNDLDNLLQEVSQQWKELLDENSNNLEVALSLMDTSSIGKARYIGNFNALKEKLQSNLKEHVDLNYQGFNSSIGLYRTVASTISNSQDNINNAKELLIRARADLATRRPVLKEMRATSLKYEKMINVLSTIEELKEVPEMLEGQINKKQFLSAFRTMSEAAHKADDRDLNTIPVVKSLQSYLNNQESTLFNILHDELENHLYLKSPYCDSRWNSYSQARDDFNNLEQVIEDKVRFDLSEESTSFSGSSTLDSFLSSFDRDTPIEDDDRKTPEADSFSYIRLIVETCFKMNRLSSLFDIIFQNISAELHKLVDKTIIEVQQRFPKLKDLTESTTTAKTNLFLVEDEDSALMTSNSSDNGLLILKDLIWTLYSKFLAVLQGHRVIYEVVLAISQRQKGRKHESEFLDYDFFKVYYKVEQEIRSILSSYVTSKENLADTKRYNYESNSSSFLKQDSEVKLFKFNNMDNCRPEILKEYQALEKVLKKTVPGLVSGVHLYDPLAQQTPFVNTQSGSTYQLVVHPDVFNIRALIDPTVIFLQRSKAIFPYNDKNIFKKTDLFLENYLTDIFLPQLTHTLKSSFQHIMYDQDTLKPHPQWIKHSKKPIQKGVLDFISLVYKSCRLLNTGVTYREKYAELLVAAINWMCELYTQYFNNIVTLQDDQLILGAKLTSDSQLMTISESLLNHPPTKTNDVLEKETKYFLELRHTKAKKSASVQRNQLLEYDDFSSICLIITSLKWLLVRLQKLRKVREHSSSEDQSESSNLQINMKKRWTLLEAPRVGQTISVVDSRRGISELLILDGHSLKVFDQAVASLENLINKCIVTLRNDIRCKTIYYIDNVLTKGDYFLDNEPEERDSCIALLDSTILRNNEVMTEYLLMSEKKYILLGLSQLMNELLIYGADNLSVINLFGIKKMYLNIVVLQQTLKNIVVNPQQVDFLKVIKFYDILKQYNNNPTKLMEYLSVRRGFSYEECKIMLRLTYNEIIRKHEQANRKEAALTSKNSLQDSLIKLHEVFWGSEKVSIK